MKAMTVKNFKQDMFLTGDIETIMINGRHIPIALSWFNKLSCFTAIIDFSTENLVTASKILLKNWMAELVLYAPTKSTIYFHNLGKFDSYLLMDELKNENLYKTKIILRGGIIYEIKIVYNAKDFTFRDSYLLIPLSLKEAALIFNKNYFKKEFNFAEYTIEKYKKDKNTLKDYIENDVITLYELLINFKAVMQETFPCVEEKQILKKLTLYSLTQYIFLKYYYKHTFAALFSEKDEAIRKSYLGGISDIYKPFGENLVMLDFNSMYPYIMTELKLGLDKIKIYRNITNMQEFCLNPGFMEVDVICKKELRLPFLALKHNNKILQPTGNFRTIITNIELKHCLENYKEYYEFIPITGYSYDKNEVIFKEFIEILYEKRKSTNNPIYKKMMNSLSGRFGMLVTKSMKSEIVTEDREIEYSNKDTVEIISLDEKTFIYNYSDSDTGIDCFDNKKKDIELKKFNIRVDWAATITARGRIIMQELKEKVDIYYVDTDAIVIKKKDLEKIKEYLDEKALGKLKIVTEMDEAIFIAPKCYAYKNKEGYHFVIKSLKRADIDLDDAKLYNFFMKKLKNNNEETLKGTRINDFARNKLNFEINSQTESLSLKLNYDKREKIYDENNIWIDTKPLKIAIKE